MVDQGLIIFIKKKLEAATSPDAIKVSLLRAGFSVSDIEQGFTAVHKQFGDTHQDIVAANNFLPPLKKKQEYLPNIIEKGTYHSPAGPLFNGRLRRSDFILGFLFFFGCAVVFLAALLELISLINKGLYTGIVSYINSGSNDWIIILPVLVLPITVMILSLAARRLHDIDLPGSLAFIFLAFFLPTTDLYTPYEVGGLYVIAIILFFVMITKRGVKTPTQYGAPYEMHGSFFARIINI